MPKARKPEKAIASRAQTGADLRAWRRAVGLLAREVAELIGVSERSVLRAERSPEPGGKILEGFQRLQDRLLEGRLNIGPILRRRWSRGRVTKTPRVQIMATTGHFPRETVEKNRTSEPQKPRQTGRSF
jgi:transcriptional regulator with XRE-family HTH domain